VGLLFLQLMAAISRVNDTGSGRDRRPTPTAAEPFAVTWLSQ
jgi:hypothetical protein